MLNYALLLALTLSMAAPNGPRGDDGVKDDKARFATTIAVDFSGAVVPPGHFIVSLVNSELVFSNESNMIAVQRVPVTAVKNNKYFHFPKLEVIQQKPNVILNYFSQDDRYTAKGVERPDYKAPTRSAAQANRKDEKVAAPNAQDDYATNLKAAIKKLESQVAHCEDVAIRRNAKLNDEKLLLCVCPIAQKWKLPPAKSLFRKDRHFKKKSHGFSLLVDDKGKVVDCSVWDKKPTGNPFKKEYTYEGDGTAPQQNPATH